MVAPFSCSADEPDDEQNRGYGCERDHNALDRVAERIVAAPHIDTINGEPRIAIARPSLNSNFAKSDFMQDWKLFGATSWRPPELLVATERGIVRPSQ